MRIPDVSPTLLDRAGAFVSPEAGLRRLRARAGLQIISGRGGGYDAARSDKPGLKRYSPGTGSGITDIHGGLQTIRDRSRDQARNNPIGSGAISTVVTSTVGTGLRVQPNIDREFLGMSDEDADAWEAQAERLFRNWAETTDCDLEGEVNFYEKQGLTLRSILESGDVLRVRRFVWDGGDNRPSYGWWGTKVQLIEADRISNPSHQWDTQEVAGGVQVDGHGRVQGYHVQRYHPGDAPWLRGGWEWDFLPARHPATGQRVAQLLLERRRVAQRRGVPYLAPVIDTLKQLDRYGEAELNAAVLSAMFTVFLTSDAPEGAPGPLDPIAGSAAADRAPSDPGDVALGMGSVVELGEGEGVEFANPARPNAQFDPFFTANVRQIGVALEMPHEMLMKAFTSSYSASRAAMLEAYKFFRTRRHLLVGWLCQPCYEDVMDEAVARGLIDAPGYWDSPLVRRAYLGTLWTGDAMPQLDPVKEAAGARQRVDAGFSTIDREAREMNGTSFMENHRQRRKEKALRKKDGLDVESVGDLVSSQTTSHQTQGPENSDDEDASEAAAQAVLAGHANEAMAHLIEGEMS